MPTPDPAVACRAPIEPAETPPPPPPDDDIPMESDVPDDYCPADTTLDAPQVDEPMPAETSPPSTLASSADRSKVEADPVVQRTMDLFDGILLDVRRATPPPAGSKTE